MNNKKKQKQAIKKYAELMTELYLKASMNRVQEIEIYFDKKPICTVELEFIDSVATKGVGDACPVYYTARSEEKCSKCKNINACTTYRKGKLQALYGTDFDIDVPWAELPINTISFKPYHPVSKI